MKLTSQEIKEHYAILARSGDYQVCPITGIAFVTPTLSASLGKVYFDSRHPLGVRSNYPELYNRLPLLSKLSSPELAGIILATFEFYGSINSELSRFKQNELLWSRVSKPELIAFVEWLAEDFVPSVNRPKAAFAITDNFDVMYLFSYQYTCFNIKHNIGFDTLTVADAIEKKVILVGGRDTIKSMCHDIRTIFNLELFEALPEESAIRARNMLADALQASTDDDVEKICAALIKRLGDERCATFVKEFRRYRSFFERQCLLKKEDDLDLDFSSYSANAENAIVETEETTTIVNDGKAVGDKENEQSEIAQRRSGEQTIGQDAQGSGANIASIAERLARIRAAASSR